jgi:hypothetical protein
VGTPRLDAISVQVLGREMSASVRTPTSLPFATTAAPLIPDSSKRSIAVSIVSSGESCATSVRIRSLALTVRSFMETSRERHLRDDVFILCRRRRTAMRRPA